MSMFRPHSSVIDCSTLADEMLVFLANKFDIYKKKYDIKPQISMLVIGNNAKCTRLIKKQTEACNIVGVELEVIMLDRNVSEEKLILEINKFNHDNKTHAICLFNCTNRTISTRVLSAINPEKDIEGISPINLGLLYMGVPAMVPCTARAVLIALQSQEVDLTGKNIVVIGRSIIAGRAIALMLLKENCTVTICHSYTKNLIDITSRADIVISAVGKKKFLTAEHFNNNQVVIDVGTEIEEFANNHIVLGDVDFDNVKNKVKYITPVPGIGLVGIACFLNNLLDIIDK